MILILVVMTAMSCSTLIDKLPVPSPRPPTEPRVEQPVSGAVAPTVAGAEEGDLSTVALQGDGRKTFLPGWSWFTRIPSKDFTVVGIIVLRNVEMPSVELMNAARELNADDIINIRVDIDRMGNNDTCLAASAVAIKYTTAPYEGDSRKGTGNPNLGTGAVSWSEYTNVPNKDYLVVGIVTVDCKESGTPSADLMDKAKALGAHDIINILVDTKGNQIVGASAVAIRYTNVIPPDSSISSSSDGQWTFEQMMQFLEVMSLFSGRTTNVRVR